MSSEVKKLAGLLSGKRSVTGTVVSSADGSYMVSTRQGLVQATNLGAFPVSVNDRVTLSGSNIVSKRRKVPSSKVYKV